MLFLSISWTPDGPLDLGHDTHKVNGLIRLVELQILRKLNVPRSSNIALSDVRFNIDITRWTMHMNRDT